MKQRRWLKVALVMLLIALPLVTVSEAMAPLPPFGSKVTANVPGTLSLLEYVAV